MDTRQWKQNASRRGCRRSAVLKNQPAVPVGLKSHLLQWVNTPFGPPLGLLKHGHGAKVWLQFHNLPGQMDGRVTFMVRQPFVLKVLLYKPLSPHGLSLACTSAECRYLQLIYSNWSMSYSSQLICPYWNALSVKASAHVVKILAYTQLNPSVPHLLRDV